MNLVIDIGNTNRKAALFSKSIEPLQVHRSEILFLNELKEWFVNHKISHCLISVSGEEDTLLEDFIQEKCKLIKLNAETKLPIKNLYKTPETLGDDRISNVCGAAALYPESDVLVIDIGTCITYDFLDHKKRYHGGSISPGMQMRFRALHEFTARLPLVKPTEEIQLTGSTTAESILSGTVNGIAEECNGIISQYTDKHPSLKTIITGGDAPYFEKRIKMPIFAAPMLSFIGMNEILKHNVHT
jgi:type III pantothenate kinase